MAAKSTTLREFFLMMAKTQMHHSHAILCGLLAIALAQTAQTTSAQDASTATKDSVFSKTTFDLGIVVSDLDKAAKFYSEVIGMTEVKGFSVPAKTAAAFGLTDNQPAVVRRFVMSDVKGAPVLKLMAFPDAPGQKPSQRFIHSSLGFSYLTLFVNDMDAAVQRAEKSGVKFLGETPAKLGGANYLAVCKDIDGNFIELIGPSQKEANAPTK